MLAWDRTTLAKPDTAAAQEHWITRAGVARQMRVDQTCHVIAPAGSGYRRLGVSIATTFVYGARTVGSLWADVTSQNENEKRTTRGTWARTFSRG
jgi:uncharacterized protein YjlB